MTLPTDTLYRFLFANAPVKGELVQLPHTWHTITHTAKKRAYPAVVTEILGQMTAACTLLSANLKFDGSMIMQIHGDGPIQLLVVECRSDLTIRATAKVAENANIDAQMDLQTLLNQNGNARFAITLDPNERQPGQQPYQGIVPLHGETIAEILMHYMSASEQLDTHIELAARQFGLPKDSVILLEQIRTLDKKRLREHMGRVDGPMMHRVDAAIAVSFGLHPDTLV